MIHFIDKKLEQCMNYGDVFELVKQVVKKILGRKRAGLMLYLGNLPINVGALHGIGTNGIVLNKKLLKMIQFKSRIELNSYVFSLLLHEYIHSLGYVNEGEVRELVYKISSEVFSPSHPAARFAVKLPAPKIDTLELQPNLDSDNDIEIIKDFDRSSQTYIS